MKRWLLIGGGVSILLILIGIWIYLLFFGAPKSGGDVFANLGLSGSDNARPLVSTPTATSSTQSNVANVRQSPLRQLTTRPVAGFRAKGNMVYYAERGTGYIYTINVYTGEESQITQSTIPRVSEAVFAPDFSSVAYSVHNENTRTSLIVSLLAPEGDVPAFNNIALPPQASNIAYRDATTVLYTVPVSPGTTGYSFDLSTQVRQEIFTLPLAQVHVIWGKGLSDIYVYTKPSDKLEGYAYQVAGNNLTPTALYGNGLSLLANNVALVHTYIRDGALVSTGQTDSISATTPGVLMIPEKCTFVSINNPNLWCAIPKGKPSADFITNWYKGKVATNDELWSINLNTRSATAVIDFETISGRLIDAIDLATAEGELFVFFRNRSDNTLWMFDQILLASE